MAKKGKTWFWLDMWYHRSRNGFWFWLNNSVRFGMKNTNIKLNIKSMAQTDYEKKVFMASKNRLEWRRTSEEKSDNCPLFSLATVPLCFCSSNIFHEIFFSEFIFVWLTAFVSYTVHFLMAFQFQRKNIRNALDKKKSIKLIVTLSHPGWAHCNNNVANSSFYSIIV